MELQFVYNIPGAVRLRNFLRKSPFCTANDDTAFFVYLQFYELTSVRKSIEISVDWKVALKAYGCDKNVPILHDSTVCLTLFI